MTSPEAVQWISFSSCCVEARRVVYSPAVRICDDLPWPGLPLVLPDLRKPGNVDPASLVWAIDKAFEVEDGQEFGRVQLFLDRPRLEKYPAKAKSELRADTATSAACAGPPVAKGRGEGETTEPAQPASLPTANNYSLASFWQALLQEAASARRQKHSIGVAAA